MTIAVRTSSSTLRGCIEDGMIVLRAMRSASGCEQRVLRPKRTGNGTLWSRVQSRRSGYLDWSR
jgi:hypothetical protein